MSFYSVDTGDRADGGAGNDLIEIRFNYFAVDPASPAQHINFTLGPNGATSILQLNSIDTLVVSNIERLLIDCGKGDDFITGGVLDDTMFGNEGNDHLYGGAGNDQIDGGSGVQDLNGGAGNDQVSFDTSASGDAMTISNDLILNLGTAGTVRNFEWFYSITTGNGADIFNITQAQGISIISGGGADTITFGDGGAGIDSGTGDDVIVSGNGFDAIDGGDGNNMVHMGGAEDEYSHEFTRSYLGMESIWGEAGNDRIYTAAGSDRTYGGDGNDLIYNGQGADNSYGGRGNDTMFGETGTDHLYGGDGNDAVNGDTDPYLDFIAQDGDTLEGGNGDDGLTGGAGADAFYSGSGNDGIDIAFYFNGSMVADALVDHAFGGTGQDTLFANGPNNNGSTDRMEVILAPLTLVKINGVTVADATGIEALTVNSYSTTGNLIEGGDFNDFVLSGNGDDVVRAFGGNDIVNSYFGTDQFFLGDGDDQMQAWLGGADRFIGGAGNDRISVSVPRISETMAGGLGVIDGGSGDDTLTIFGSDRSFSFTGTAIFVDGVKVASVTGFEHVTIYGQSSNDSITGTAGNDTLNGGFGNDALSGLGGNDLLDGSYGDDTLLGGNGDDTLLAGSGLDQHFGGAGDDAFTLVQDGLTDTIAGGDGIDHLTLNFGLTAPILMTGNLQTGATISTGGTSQATVSGIEFVDIFGSSGNDSLLGGDGNDTISANSGADSVTSGAGNDLVSFSVSAGQSDTINLGQGTDTAQIFSSVAGNLNFVLSANMQLLIGGQSFGTLRGAEIAQFYGGSGADVLSGGGFGDTLFGGSGGDTLSGFGGDDQFSVTADAAADQIFGGNGSDTVFVYGGTMALNVDVSQPGTLVVKSGGVAIVTANAVEVLVLYGSTANDTLRGLGLDDTMSGNLGNDSLFGGAGVDQLFGGGGADSMTGGLGADQFLYYNTADGGDTIRDFAADDELVFSHFALGGGTVTGGSVTLVAGGAPVMPPGSSTGVFLYDTDTGVLRYDNDGAGVNAAILIATLLDGGVAASLLADQFTLV